MFIYEEQSQFVRISVNWLNSYKAIEDLFITVSNGNNTLKFYLSKSFKVSREILCGFITVLRNTMRGDEL